MSLDSAQLTDDERREVVKLILSKGGFAARDWLVEERGYASPVAKALVDPLLDSDVATAEPLFDLLGGLLLLALGVGLVIVAISASSSGGRLYNRLMIGALVGGGFLALRGLWMTGRYAVARWGN